MSWGDALVLLLFFGFGYLVVGALWGEINKRFVRRSRSKSSSGSGKQAEAPTTGDPWYVVLGVQPHASNEEIKAAYREKIRQYHPDKVTGLGPEIQRTADEMSKRINRAYEQAFSATQE